MNDESGIETLAMPGLPAVVKILSAESWSYRLEMWSAKWLDFVSDQVVRGKDRKAKFCGGAMIYSSKSILKTWPKQLISRGWEGAEDGLKKRKMTFIEEDDPCKYSHTSPNSMDISINKVISTRTQL